MVIPLSTALSAAVVAWLLTPVLRPFLENEPDRKSDLLRVPVATLAALAGLGAASVAHGIAELVAFAAVGVGCALLVVIDVMVCRLPDVLVACTAAALLVPLAVAAATSAEWSAFGRSLLAAAVLLGGYFLLALIFPTGLGLGDVKFAVVVGAFLGWFGWGHVAAGTVVGFTVNGVVALVVLFGTRGGPNTQIPFGPSMVIGAICAVAVL